MLRKLSILSFLIAYLLLLSYTLISKSSYIQIGIQSKASAYSSLKLYLLSLQYRPLSINIRSIILLEVPYCHIITPKGVANLRPQVSIALSRHSAYYLVVIQIPPYRGQQRFISPNRIDSIPLVSSKLIYKRLLALCRDIRSPLGRLQESVNATLYINCRLILLADHCSHFSYLLPYYVLLPLPFSCIYTT